MTREHIQSSPEKSGTYSIINRARNIAEQALRTSSDQVRKIWTEAEAKFKKHEPSKRLLLLGAGAAFLSACTRADTKIAGFDKPQEHSKPGDGQRAPDNTEFTGATAQPLELRPVMSMPNGFVNKQRQAQIHAEAKAYQPNTLILDENNFTNEAKTDDSRLLLITNVDFRPEDAQKEYQLALLDADNKPLGRDFVYDIRDFRVARLDTQTLERGQYTKGTRIMKFDPENAGKKSILFTIFERRETTHTYFPGSRGAGVSSGRGITKVLGPLAEGKFKLGIIEKSGDGSEVKIVHPLSKPTQ